PRAVERIAKVVPTAKIIVLLRDPVSRAYSHYQQIVRKGWETLSFEEAVAAEPERLAPEIERMAADPGYHSEIHRRFSYLSRGRYIEQMERVFRHFPREQVLVLKSEEALRERQKTFDTVTGFLGVKSCSVADVPNRRVADYAPIDPATRERLREQFEPDNVRLYALLGRDLGW
ncbi:MAG TPA: sulfotransferase, partial [Armatimonadota bacterium]|nr:sulfotransferase [Armatimonadota bacterium]